MVIIYNQIRNNVFAKQERAEGRLCVAAHHMAALLRWGVRTTILMSEIWVEIRRHGAAGEENTNNRQKMRGSGET